MLFRGESVGDCNSELGDEISITVCVWDCDLGERRCLCLFSSQFNFECVLYDCDQWVQCGERYKLFGTYHFVFSVALSFSRYDLILPRGP